MAFLFRYVAALEAAAGLEMPRSIPLVRAWCGRLPGACTRG